MTKPDAQFLKTCVNSVLPFHRALLAFLILHASVIVLYAAPTPVTPLREAPHSYFQQQPSDEFSRLIPRIASGEVQLDATSEQSYLLSLLRELRVPVSSQLLVFSATSLQSALVHASNPRALYFNDEIYVGYVPGGRLEIAAIDPTLGPVFQILTPSANGAPQVVRSDKCMNCHAGRTTRGVPGLFAESVIAMEQSGASLEGFRREQVGHTIPLKDRLGGWHVTGAHEHGEHLGNLLGENTPKGVERFANPPGKRFNLSRYPVATSDLLPHLLHEHQLGFHNHVTLGTYRTREALTAGRGHISIEDTRMLNELARDFVRYILFANEARLPSGGVKPDATFAKDFTSTRQPSKNGTSLRDLDLRTRLLRYRCSYMVLTPAFAAMPKDYLTRVIAGLKSALRESGAPPEFSYLPTDEKRAITALLNETLPAWR